MPEDLVKPSIPRSIVEPVAGDVPMDGASGLGGEGNVPDGTPENLQPVQPLDERLDRNSQTPLPDEEYDPNNPEVLAAHARAVGEKTEMDKAAGYRTVMNSMGGFEKQPDENEIGALTRFYELHEDNPVSDLDHRADFVGAAGSAAISGDTIKTSRVVEKGMREAAKHESYAERLGDWAEALHRHPVSPDYLKAYGWDEIDIKPESLSFFEDFNSERQAEVDAIRATTDRLRTEIADDPTRTFVDELSKLARRRGRAAEFKELEAHDETTVADLKALVQEAENNTALQQERLITKHQKLLDDVRSGVASRPPELPTEKQAA